VAAASPAVVGHKAQGTVDALDLKAGTVSINHGAVATLKWPPMTMEFKAANAGLLAGLKPGQPVSFEFVERQPGEYVVTSIAAPLGTRPAAAAAPSPPAPPPRATASSHSGH
jgi:Cu(I)/Ag(I) efflux system membrane fusion protein